MQTNQIVTHVITRAIYVTGVQVIQPILKVVAMLNCRSMAAKSVHHVPETTALPRRRVVHVKTPAANGAGSRKHVSLFTLGLVHYLQSVSQTISAYATSPSI